MRIRKVIGILALLVVCATSAMALSGGGGSGGAASYPVSGGLGPIGPQYAGTLANNAALSINWALGNQVIFQCQGTNTINAPTNPVTGMLYSITMIYNSVNACNATNLTWPATFLAFNSTAFSTVNDNPSTNTGPANTWWFVWDGTNYRFTLPSMIQAWNTFFYQFNAGGAIGGAHFSVPNSGAANSSVNLNLISGSIISTTGGAVPTITCSGGSTGTSVTAGSTNNRGEVVTSSSASTNCTITWSAASTWPQAPFCVFGSAGATITPVAFSAGACGTSTCVFDFASASSLTVHYVCM